MLRLGLMALLVATIATGAVAQSGRAFAQTPVPTQPIDPFGQELMLPAKTIVYVAGAATWDTAFDTLVEAFKSVQAYLDKAGQKASGLAMTIYTSIDDTGFEFQAALPVTQAPRPPAESDVKVGTAPTGKALKFVHRGPFEATVSTYDAITHYLDERQINAQDLLIEEYVTDLATTPDEKLVINILVPIN